MRKPYMCCDTCVYGYGTDVDDQPCCSCVDGENYEKAHDAETENEQDQLKPCPFCGGESVFVHMHGSADNMWGFVKCAKKTKHCCEQPRIRPKDLAIADWNRRKPT